MNTFTFATELNAGDFGWLFVDITVSTRMETHGDDDTPYRKADEVRAVIVRGARERYAFRFRRPQGCPPSMVGQDILNLLDETIDHIVLRNADEAIQEHDAEEHNV